MEQYEQYIKVPKDRVAVIIGEKGTTKRELESNLKLKLDVDSKEGEVRLISKDSLALFTAVEVIKAIARGFNPSIAQLLLKTDYTLELMNITDYAKGKNHMVRLKGRVIGESGKSWKTIEELSGARLTVYGKTIGIIGEGEAVTIAKKGVDMLLTGAPHNTVFRTLEKWRRHQEPAF
ncbi:MAG: KH domain-containing protein [Candidatus Woesearchaeota archaeon]|nr:KH domain-containing protein [Candidatus Woesearchaeota archaeon]